MFKTICFAGTTEGKEMISFLCENKIQTIGCIATEYGETLLAPSAYLTTYAKRMDEKEMEVFFAKEQPDLIIDATHPFAREVTKNIQTSAKTMQIPYLRLLREETPISDALYFDSEVEASAYLNKTTGTILLTTGSKHLEAFTNILDYKNRCYARVLSLPSVVTACNTLGFYGKNLFAMQGPFSEELNYALLKEIKASYLVTKESGKTGGFYEKVDAAKRAGASLLVIKRPKEEGMSLAACKQEILKQRKSAKSDMPQQDISVKQEQENLNDSIQKHQIACIGIGVGNQAHRSLAADAFIKKATHLIGARRMLSAVEESFGEKVVAITAEDIFTTVQEILNHTISAKIAIVFSGDTGFYSGTKKLFPLLEDLSHVRKDVLLKTLPGISSMSYLASQVKLSYDDAKIVSLHGKGDDLVRMVEQNHKVFSIFGKTDDLSKTCMQLTKEGYGEVWVYVGEDLSYPSESIYIKQAKDCVQLQTTQLAVAFFRNEKVSKFLTLPGISDDSFLRDKVPMTKEEIRTIVLAKLKLTKHAVFYDIGAGSGSVSIEVERLLQEGIVYAVEKKEIALALLAKNKEKFHANNMQIVSGSAPEVLKEMPPATHVFIGGSSGNLEEIIEWFMQKNPAVRIVITAITLETIAKTLEITKKISDITTDIAYVTVAKAKKVAEYHMMMGQNPVAIFTICKEKN